MAFKKYSLNPIFYNYSLSDLASLDINDSGGDSDSESSTCEVESDKLTNNDIINRLPIDPFDCEKSLPSFETYIKGQGCSEDGEVFEEVNWVCRTSAKLSKLKLGSPICDGKAVEVFGLGRVNSTNDPSGEHHEAIKFALPYLGLKDLLSVEMVCKSLRDVVRSNNLLWRNICIEPPLTIPNNGVLEKLISRAEGTLECLTLVRSFTINSNALMRVFLTNPKLRKLKVPGCCAINLDELACNLKSLKSIGKLGLEVLRVGGIFGATKSNFEVFSSMVSHVDNSRNQGNVIPNNPIYYNIKNPFLLCDGDYDERVIDIEPCPKCGDVRLIYDCPLKSCQEKSQAGGSVCRGCITCINRCCACGRCFEDCWYEESFALDSYCNVCYASCFG